MKTKKLLWAALSMTAALMMTACSSSDSDITETPVAPKGPKTIPYTVTVGERATSRATVDSDNQTLKFASGDKLYITGTNIQGVLDLQAGDEGKSSGATFSGDLTYSGEGSPADDLSLTATLVSAQQTDGSEVTINATTGAVTVNYPTTAYCADVATAVQKYSRLTGTCEYSEKSFSLTQQTAFLNFEITFEDGTATNTPLTAVVSNGGSPIATLNVTTTTESEKVVAKFVLPVASGTTLSSAKVTMGSKAAISFGASQTLTGKVYNVKKTEAAPATITVTWNKDDITGSGNSFTKDGVTITCGKNIDFNYKNFPGGGTFTTDLGNFTKIEVTAHSFNQFSGTAWSGNSTKQTWTGNASSVSFSGNISGMVMAPFNGNIKFVFTIEPTN